MAARKAKTPAAAKPLPPEPVTPTAEPAPPADPVPVQVDPPSAPIEFLDTHAEIQKELRALCGLSFAAQKHVFELRRLIFGDGNCID